MVLIGLPRDSSAESQRIRYLDDFSGNYSCESDLLEFLVQEVDRFDTYATSPEA